MLCKNCNHTVPDGGKFCPVCGATLETPAPAQNYWSEETTVLSENQMPQQWQQPLQPQQPQQPRQPRQNPNPGWHDEVIDRRPAPSNGRKYASSAKPAAPKLLIPAIIGVVALVLVVVLIGTVTNWFGLTGPAMTILSAANKTLTADSFTVEFTMSDGYDDIEGVAYIMMDMEERELNVLMELEVDGETGELVIYDEYLVLMSDGYSSYQDIGDELDMFFDSYEETGSGELDWEEILDERDPDAYEEMSEYIDFEVLNECLAAYGKKLNDKNWLKENAGYSTSSEGGVKYHTFAPEMSKFLTASVEFLEPAVLDSDDYEDMVDSLEDAADEIDDAMEMEIALGIKGGKLVAVNMLAESDGTEVEMKITFSDIGKTKLDLEELAEMLEDAMDE